MIKKIAKYIANTLAVVNALIIGLHPIWDIPHAENIIATLAVVVGVLGGGLLCDKAYHKIHDNHMLR